MTSTYVLSTGQLQQVQAPSQRYRLYVAFHSPVSFSAASRDVLNDNGHPVIPPAQDLLATKRPPFTPAVTMGGQRIGFVGEPLYFDASRSVQRHNILAWGHVWSATGSPAITTYSTPVVYSDIVGIDSGDSGHQQAQMTWHTPGNYLVTCTVEDRYGAVGIGQRQVRIYPDRLSAAEGVYQVDSLTGSISQGGYTVTLTTDRAFVGWIPPASLPTGTYLPITLMAEGQVDLQSGQPMDVTVGPYQQFVPGQPYSDPRIIFCGYVKSATCHYDDTQNTVQYQCQTPELIALEANVLTTAFYNATWKTKNSAGQWNSQKAVMSGSDQLIADLTMMDCYHAMLRDHCTLGRYHDIITWPQWISDPRDPYFVSAPTYTSITVNQGTVWSGIQTMAQNEFSECYAELDGSIRIGPSINMHDAGLWNYWYKAPQTNGILGLTPNFTGTRYGRWPIDPAVGEVNAAHNLGFPVNQNDSGVQAPIAPWNPNNRNKGTAVVAPSYVPPYLAPDVTYTDAWHIYNWRNEFFPGYVPSQTTGQTPYGKLRFAPGTAAWLPCVNILWGPNQYPVAQTTGTIPDRDPSQALIMPVLCHFSDQMQWDGQNDTTIRPFDFEITENYITRATFVKCIGYKVQHDTAWGAFYPTNTFDKNGLTTYRLPVGAFTLFDSLVLPDMTQKSAQYMAWVYLWQLARLAYFNQNARYQAQIDLGMFPCVRLHDLVQVTRSRSEKGSPFTRKLFAANQITHTFDLTQGTWKTQIIAGEVSNNTSSFAYPITPPYGPPTT